MKKYLFFFALLICNILFIEAQNLNIPDINLKAYLIENSAINTNEDNEIQITEAAVFTGEIDCSNRQITDATGLEAFINITSLWVDDNQLKNLNLSKNTALIYLSCYNNQLESLDLSNNTLLQILSCDKNKLTHLDVSKNIDLKFLSCWKNQLINLDLKDNKSLLELYCWQNQLAKLELSNNTVLKILHCDENKLKILNLKNDDNLTIIEMKTNKNPQLYCIQVNDVNYAYSNTNWQKDDIAYYNTNCILSTMNTNKSTIKLYPNPAKDILRFSEKVSDVTITDKSGKKVKEYPRLNNSINLGNLDKGIYYISFTENSQDNITKKIIKE